jgi:hypothetical protein
MIDKGAIVVSTEEEFAGRTETVFYDVRDLMVTPEGAALTGEKFDTKLKSLVEVIVGTIAADTWQRNGGQVGGIQTYNNKLIVTHTSKTQEQVAQLLAKLREQPATRPAASPAITPSVLSAR